MDLKNFQNGFVLIIQLILAINPVTLKSVSRECRECKPGYYASRLCSEVYDTVCKPCPKGTFTQDYNVFKSCAPCSICFAGEFVSRECSTRRDSVCESCAAVKDNVNNNFMRSCLQGDDPGDRIRLNDPSDVKLEKEDSLETIESSSDFTVIPEGSGSDVNIELDDINYPVTNDSDSIEGSGFIPDIQDGESKNATTVSVILPDDGDEDNITTTTTTKAGVIGIGDGIVLENTTSDTSKIDTDLVKPLTTTTTVKTINLDDSVGVVIAGNTTQKNDYTQKDTDDTIDGGVIDVDVNIVNDEPQTGASHKQQPNATGGVKTGIVVTIGLLAALVFFVIGFVVSRYWSGRQERTFNVQEAERRNGKAPVECSGIEYKDPENNIPNKTNGSLPSKTANGNTPEVSDKPITRSSNPSTASQPNNTTEGPYKPRAESEIRYIDEEPADKAETDALLPNNDTSSNQDNEVSHPEEDSTPETEVVNNVNSNIEREADENTPMISNNTDSINS